MRRLALLPLTLASAGLLGGCTGTGVFFDHTFQWYGHNPNAPAGSSETFLRMRGVPVDAPPIMPQQGNIWPDNTAPDLTMQDIERQQNEAAKRNGGQPPNPGSGPANGPNPAVNRANDADRGLPPPATPPRPPGQQRPIPTPSGPALDLGGPRAGYRDLQPPSGGGSNPNTNSSTVPGGGILVPNGNGTSTLISPDGSIKTVPTR